MHAETRQQRLLSEAESSPDFVTMYDLHSLLSIKCAFYQANTSTKSCCNKGVMSKVTAIDVPSASEEGLGVVVVSVSVSVSVCLCVCLCRSLCLSFCQ